MTEAPKPMTKIVAGKLLDRSPKSPCTWGLIVSSNKKGGKAVFLVLHPWARRNDQALAQIGNGRPWPHGRPWPVFAGSAWPAKAGHARPRPGMVLVTALMLVLLCWFARKLCLVCYSHHVLVTVPVLCNPVLCNPLSFYLTSHLMGCPD